VLKPILNTHFVSKCREREKTIILTTHTFYHLDITGCEVTNDGPSAVLWQFGQEREITNYYGCHGKVTRIHFDPFGQKFGAGDTTGALCLWEFDSHAQSNKPYYVSQKGRKTLILISGVLTFFLIPFSQQHAIQKQLGTLPF
jgi:hypothetical protein